MQQVSRRHPRTCATQPEPPLAVSRRTHATPPETTPAGEIPDRARFDWLCEAARQPGKAAHLALMLAWQAARASSPAVKPGRRALQRFGISRDACYDGLRRLETAGLVHVWRLPGRLPQVILVEPRTDQPLRLQ